ncbi:hypothetical protein [Candidatus Uabimicrobium sp. HlEnr_7]|uniref:hypothetical protein n=1 Tax=Candidatus Uabimicrobium helgolandensis TaxID=3095367 RepID=UPI0035562484
MKYIKCCLVLLLSLNCTIAAQSFKLEQNLPDSTLFIASVPNGKAAISAIMETGYAKLACSEEMQQITNPIWESSQQHISPIIQQFKKITGALPQNLLYILQGEISFAIVDYYQGIHHGPPFFIDAVISISLEGNFKKGKELVLTHLNNLVPNAPTVEIEGKEFFIIEKSPIFLGFIEQSLIIATSERRISSLLTKNIEKTLVKDTSYNKIRNRSQTTLSLFHLKVSNIIEKKVRGLNSLIYRLGLHDTKSISGSIGVHNNNFRCSFIIETTENERKGILNFVPTKKLSNDLFYEIPKDSVYYKVSTFDLSKLFAEIEQLSTSSRQLKSKVEKMLNISLQQDLIDTFGKEAAMFIDVSSGTTNTVVITKMSNSERFITTVKKITNLYPNIELRTINYNKQLIYYIHLNSPSKQVEKQSLLNLAMLIRTGFHSFFIKDNKMYASNSTLSLKRYIHNSQKKANGINIKLAENQTTYSYIDTPRGMKYIYNNATNILESLAPFVNLITNIPLDIDIANLPLIEDFSADLYPTITTITNSKNEIILETNGSVLGGVISTIYFSFSSLYTLGLQVMSVPEFKTKLYEKFK